MKKLRTFMPIQMSPHYGPNVFFSKKVIGDLLAGLKYLKKLSLRFFRITEVPNQIGELKLLRSLDLSYTLITVLPEAICNLVYLKILLVRGWECLTALPANLHRLTNLLHLDICYAHEIKEMPPRLGEIFNLEMLSNFIVGSKSGQELKELGPFQHLQKELSIRNLHKVERLEDAKVANLHGKSGLTSLSFSWISEDESTQVHDQQLKLLELLQPPKYIQQLRVYRYIGKRLPYWCGNPFINNITSMTLFSCRSLEYLPSFGQLPSLKQLHLHGLSSVCIIGPEFYGTGKPFQSLRTLYIENMDAWEEWSSCKGIIEERPFCCLRELVIKNCPKLKRGLPRSLDSLATLTISGCPLLTTTEATLSLPFLHSLWLENSEAGLFGSLVDLCCLTKLVAIRVQRFPSFRLRYFDSWVAIEDLEIESCDDLVTLSKDIASITALKNKRNKEYARLFEFTCTRLPLALTSLSIVSCQNLRLLPKELTILSSVLSPLRPVCKSCHLIELRLGDCPSLEPSQFYHMRLPHTLKKLWIDQCKGLESLERLGTEEHHSHSLQELRIRSCENFKKLPDQLSHFLSLTLLAIEDCPHLELDHFPPLPCNLSTFRLFKCPNVQCLPQGGLPPSLESLAIGFCEKLKTPLGEWGLHGLRTLLTLEVGGGMECVNGMVGFPCADGGSWARLLPASLVNLSINGVESVKCLVDGLRVHLTSLETLHIRKCPKLYYLPKEGLPASLEALWILESEMLKAMCSEPKGKYRSVIQQIPDIRFEEELEFKQALPPPDSNSPPCLLKDCS